MPLGRLLIVEDHDTTRRSLARALGLLGFEVTTVGTVAEGLAALEPPPDGLILDLALPDGDGETVLEHVRRGALPTRVVVCTGSYDSDRLRLIAEKLGPKALMLKPIDFDKVIRAYMALANKLEGSDVAEAPRTRQTGTHSADGHR
jgi:DNA-binding response OmpR family regulator